MELLLGILCEAYGAMYLDASEDRSNTFQTPVSYLEHGLETSLFNYAPHLVLGALSPMTIASIMPKNNSSPTEQSSEALRRFFFLSLRALQLYHVQLLTSAILSAGDRPSAGDRGREAELR